MATAWLIRSQLSGAQIRVKPKGMLHLRDQKLSASQSLKRIRIREVLDAGVPVDNGQTIVNITVPENIGERMSIYGREFEISGITEYTDVEIIVARLNGETGVYEILELPDGDDVIYAGAGAFSQILELEYGENNLLIISYRSSEKDESMIQYNSISVTALRRTLEQMLIRVRNTLIDLFGGTVK